MDMNGEGNAFSSKKKHKKLKNNNISGSEVEDNVQFTDEGISKKKMNNKIAGDIFNGEHSLLGGDRSNQQANKKKKKNKTGKCKDVEFASADGIVGDAGSAGNETKHEISMKVGPVAGVKQNNNKDGKVLSDTFSAVNGGEDSRIACKRKEKYVGSYMKGGLNAGALETNDMNGNHADLVENVNNNVVIESSPNVKEKKRKKDDSFGSNSEKSRDKISKKRKEKSLACNTEEDANAGALATKDMNENHTDLIKNEINNVVIENTPNVKDKRRKKKKKDDPFGCNSEKSGDKISKRRKEKSLDCNSEEDANAGALETKDMNGNHVDLAENEIDNVVIEKTLNVKNNNRKKKKKDDSFGCNSDKSKDKISKKRKEKSLECIAEEDGNAAMLGNKDKKETAEPSENFTSSKKSRTVRFSENVEVIPLPDDSSKGEKKRFQGDEKRKKTCDDGLIRGKRFSKEEDEMVQNAVYKYIEDHQLGEQGVEMVMHCRSHPEIKDCWKEIGEALPWRPYLAVYYRAHILFERSENRKWTPEEIELVKKFHEKHGADWKTLSVELGKHRFHVKDAWRRSRLVNAKKGQWSQEEYENLFKLVNMDLSMKAYTEKKSKHGMLRDNICWEAISDELSTRSNSICCMKWYNQLRSSMVEDGIWADADDYRMLIGLVDLDASCEEDVDWDNLLEHRSADVCRKRWSQMVRHIGEYGTKPFSEQVEILSQRYCPSLLEVRESYDSRPPVD